MPSVTLLERHIHCLTDPDLKHEFMEGITSILRGEKPQYSCTYMEKVFHNLVHGSTAPAIPGIPPFDPAKVKKSMLPLYDKVQAGKVPSNGLDHGYKKLKTTFRPIQTLGRDYREELYIECQDRINRKQGDADYQNFIGYMAEVLEYCLGSGEL